MLNTAITMNALCTGNSFAGIESADTWTNLGDIHTSLYNDCMAKNLDATFIPLANQISSAQVSTALLNQQQVTQAVESFQPSFTLADLQAYYSVLPLSTLNINAAINGLRTGGLSWALKNAAQRYHLMAYAIKTAKVAPEPHLVLAGLPPHPTSPTCKPGSPCDPSAGSGYSCPVDGALVFAVGTAMLVIGVMAAPEVAILALGFWGPMSFWGGVGVGAWTAGHVSKCGF
jgi:hypothetical protein